MSLQAINLTQGIRVDQATQKGSVYDVIQAVLYGNVRNSAQTFARLITQHPSISPRCYKLRINGKGRVTPVADAPTLIEVAWLLPGKTATEFRRKGAESVCRLLGGDLSLVDEVQRRHAQVAGTAEEGFLLAASGQGSSIQVAATELPYTLEQLQQMQAAAMAIVASKEALQQCSMVLHEFPMGKYGQYIELRGKDVGLSREQLQIDRERLQMDKERAELQDRSAKRRRFDADTDEGVTFRALVAKAAEGCSDAKSFEEKARQLSLGLEVYKAFKQEIMGNHKPLQYNPQATEAIAKFIAESVAAGTKDAASRDLRSYFNAVRRETVDTGDLYSP